MYNFVGYKLKNESAARKYWTKALFGVSDICYALIDRGLKEEALKFSELFLEKKFVSAITYYEFDFTKIYNHLGVPKDYVVREYNREGNIISAKSDKSLLTKTKTEMRTQLKIVMDEITDDYKTLIKKIKI